jgi:hypothetical protein
MRLFLRIGIFLLLICLVILFLPFFASTSFGKKILVHYAEKKWNAEVEVQSLHFSWLGPQRVGQFYFKSKEAVFAFDSLRIDQTLWNSFQLFSGHWNFTGSFEIQNGALYLNHPKYPTVELSSLFVRAKKEDQRWDIDANAMLSSKEDRDGYFEIDGFISTGPIAFIDSDIKFSFSHLPTYLLQPFKYGKTLAAIMGKIASGDLTLQTTKGSGILQADIQSESFRAALDGDIKEGTLFLAKDFRSTFQLTPRLSEYILSSMNPFFITALSSNRPVTFHIQKKGFSCPLDFSLKECLIQKGSLDMGTVTCENGKTLALALKLLKLDPISSQRTSQVWFLPLDFSLQNEILHCQRLDFLVDHALHLCSWGDINLKSQKIKMNLGITEGALAYSFGLNLPKDFVLSIPIKGKINDPDINIGKGAAKIATLFAKEKFVPYGQMVPMKDNAPPPTYPIPWKTAERKRKVPFDLPFR